MASATENFDSNSPGGRPPAPRRRPKIVRIGSSRIGSGRSGSGRSGNGRGRFWGRLVRLAVAGALIGTVILVYRLPSLIVAFGLHLVPVSGQVLIDEDSNVAGQLADGPGAIGPVPGSRLLFVPLERDYADQRQPVSIAEVSADGRFDLRTLAGQSGAVRGRHLVFILPGDRPAAPDATAANDEKDAITETPSFDEVLGAERRYLEFLNPIHWLLRRPPMALRDEIYVPYMGTRHLEIKLGRQTIGAS